jgi:hypothetical protein
MRPAARLLVPALILSGAFAAVAGPVAAGDEDTQTLRGSVAIEFPSWDEKGSGCVSGPGGPAPKLKQGKKVVVYEAVAQADDSLELGDEPIARGRVGKGTINDETEACDIAFTVKNAPVIAERNSYVIEIRGVAEVKYVPAADVVDGDLGVILSLEF